MKAKYILLAIAIASVFSACNRDEKNLFDKSAAERAQAALDNAYAVLTAPANGWEMLYFPNKESCGYNLVLKFTANGQAYTTAKNFALEYNNKKYNFFDAPANSLVSDSASTWEVKNDYGPILTFDTYNKIFHAWSDPDPRPDWIEKKVYLYSPGDGFLGDYEFLIISATKDLVILKGKKHSAYSILRPMPSMTKEDYFDECSSRLEKYFGNDNIMTLEQNGNAYHLHYGAEGMFYLTQVGEKPSVEDPNLYPICPTLEGFAMSFGFNGDKNDRFFTLRSDKFISEQGSVVSAGNLALLFKSYIDDNKGWKSDLTASTGAYSNAVTAFQNQLVTLSKDSKAKVNSIAITYSDTMYHYAGAYLLRIKYEYKKGSTKQSLTADFDINVARSSNGQNIVLSYNKPANTTAETWYKQASEMPNLVNTIMGTYSLEAADALNPVNSLTLKDDNSAIVFIGSDNLK